MAQAFDDLIRSVESALQIDVVQVRGKRKIKLSMDGEYSISIYPNAEDTLMITIRRKTRSVTKETVLLYVTFLDSVC